MIRQPVYFQIMAKAENKLKIRYIRPRTNSYFKSCRIAENNISARLVIYT